MLYQDELGVDEVVLTPTRSDDDLTKEQRLLSLVIALAVDDCTRAIEAPAYKALSKREWIEAASAARFLLSQEGKGMMLGIGLPRVSLLISAGLARKVFDRLGLSEAVVFSVSQEEWKHAIDVLQWPKAVAGRYEQTRFGFAYAYA